MPHRNQADYHLRHVRRFLPSGTDDAHGLLVEAAIDGEESATVTVANAATSSEGWGLRSVSSEPGVPVEELPPGARRRLAGRLKHVLRGEVTSVRKAVLKAISPDERH